MKIQIYILIFMTKIIENTLTTLRIIMITNGKKIIGSILNGIITIIWVIGTSLVLVNINKDPIKALFFCLGAIMGSYLGSLLEEKMAMGNFLIIVKIKKDLSNIMLNELNKEKYYVSSINHSEMYDNITILVKRKKMQDCINLVTSIDQNSTIIKWYANIN